MKLRNKPSLAAECDAVAAVLVPEQLNCVGNFYADFEQVGDDEMMTSLIKANVDVQAALNRKAIS